MFFWVLQRIILSLVFIAIIHYIYVFFKENLTIPKVKDLVNKPTQQYDAIYKSMSKSDTDTKSMKQELQKYFNELSNDKKKGKTTPPGEFSFTANNSTLQYQSV
jgi:predicted phage-related endonuclease